jgi:hypothetical protein
MKQIDCEQLHVHWMYQTSKKANTNKKPMETIS